MRRTASIPPNPRLIYDAFSREVTARADAQKCDARTTVFGKFLEQRSVLASDRGHKIFLERWDLLVRR